MQNVRDALMRMVQACMTAKKMQKFYVNNGVDDSMIFKVYSDIADGICKLIGENKETFEETVTFITLNAPIISDERRTEILYGVYQKNFATCEQPKPHTFSREEMRKMVKENGGYITPEGDWK